MISLIELQKGIEEYLQGLVALDDFEDWIARESWNIHKDSDAIVQRIAYAVELRLAEYDDEHLPLAELRQELSEMMKAYSVYLPKELGVVSNGTSTVVVAEPRQWSVVPVDMSLAGAFS